MSRAQRYAAFLQRRAGTITVLFVLVTGLFTLSLRRLVLQTDFEDLLPEGQPSVVAYRQIAKRVGGLGTLNVAIESSEPAASRRLLEDLVKALRQKMASQLHSIDYTVAPIRRFYEKNGVLYLSVEELEQIDRALADAIHRAKLRNNPLYLDLEEDDEGAKTAAKQPSIAELETKLRKRAQGADRFPDGYYQGENGRLLAMFLRPNGSALAINGARSFIDNLQQVVDGLRPTRYHPSMKVGFTGSIQVTVEEHQTIVRDLLGTSLLCVTLVRAAVWLYFRRVRALALLAFTLVGGTVWAFGIAALVYRGINAQTAFLGSIIVGIGINYGILILARFLEERREGRDSSTALATALESCLRPTLIAALATGVAFGGLSIAHIRSFSQFGFIGGLGMVICWGLSFTVLPAMLSLFERVSWMQMRGPRFASLRPGYPAWFARLPVRFAGATTLVTVVLVVVSLVALFRFLPRSLETDINNLRNKPSVRQQSGTNVLDNRVADMRGESLTPAVVLADSPEQADRVCAALERLKASRPADSPPMDWCRTLNSLLPEDQERKLAIVARMRQRLDKTPRNLLPDDVRKRLDQMQGYLKARRLTARDLPEEIRVRFREKDGREGTLAFVAPPPNRGLYEITNLYAFSDTLREIKLGNGEVVRSSGDFVVFADILRSIEIDAPRTMLLAAVGVVLLLSLVVRTRSGVWLVSAALGTGMALMAGAAAALGIKFNFLNFVALPTTLGIGVDYPVNIHERHAQDGPGSMERALRRTGPAVILASVTTIIGYGVLMTSSSMALASFGKLAIIGEITCLAAALLLLPALAALLARRTS